MKPPPNFNRLARTYRWMELASFGPWLWRCRCAFLDQLGASGSALVIGDGDGRFTARLLKKNSSVQIDAVDASRAMLAVLARHAGDSSARVRLHFADARHWQSSTPYDLIVTHFFLDCLTTEEATSLALRLRACAAPDAQWLVSEFAIPKGWFGWLVARPLVAALYFAFRLLTGLSVRRLPDYRSSLAEAGFALTQQREWLGGLLLSELWTVNPGTFGPIPAGLENANGRGGHDPGKGR